MDKTAYDAALVALKQNRKEAVDQIIQATDISAEMMKVAIERHLLVEAVRAVRDEARLTHS